MSNTMLQKQNANLQRSLATSRTKLNETSAQASGVQRHTGQRDCACAQDVATDEQACEKSRARMHRRTN
eukprot:2975482-Pleurochrysis_carterae.AAC.1